jgi:hypothetical protein
MSAKKPPVSAGKALVESLSRQLPANMEFDETEAAVLDLIAEATDRLAAVRKRFDAIVADPQTAESRIAALQTAIHQLEGDIFRWTRSLNLGEPQAKSVRHQRAVNARWARAREATGIL